MNHGDKMMRIFEQLQGMMAEIRSEKTGTSFNVPPADDISSVESLSQSSSESDPGTGKFKHKLNLNREYSYNLSGHYYVQNLRT